MPYFFWLGFSMPLPCAPRGPDTEKTLPDRRDFANLTQINLQFINTKSCKDNTFLLSLA